MRRRDISRALFVSANFGAVSRNARSGERTGIAPAPSQEEERAGIGASQIANAGYEPGRVERYGAVGDGSADDTHAWKVALSVGINVCAGPNQTYKTTSALDIPQGIAVELNNSTLMPSSPNHCFNLTRSMIQLRNGRIDLSKTSGCGLYTATAIQQFLFENLTLTGSGSKGRAIQMQDCYTGLLRNIRVELAAGQSVRLFSSIPGTPINSIWLERLSVGGSTFNGNVIEVSGAAGVYFNSCDWQNNTGGPLSTDLRIESNASAGSSQVVVENCYFEHGRGVEGNCVYVGDPRLGSNSHTGIRLTNCYFQTSKQMVRIGAMVRDDMTIRDCCFNGAPGAPSYAVLVTKSPFPHVINCTGSISSEPRAG